MLEGNLDGIVLYQNPEFKSPNLVINDYKMFCHEKKFFRLESKENRLWQEDIKIK